MAKKQTLDERKKYLVDTEERCNEMWAELRPHLQPGVTLESQTKRVDIILDKLVSLGIITEEHIVEIDINVIEAIEIQLIEYHKQLAVHQDEERKNNLRIATPPPPTLLNPAGRPLKRD